ncbi:MAG: archaemetzincin family Zn-dependent metalloprotease [Candidatus Methylomirabilales bacterium]
MHHAGGILLAWIGEGPMDAGLLAPVCREVGRQFGVPARVAAAGPPPAETWEPRRRQRSSTKILRWLLTEPPGEGVRLVGITDADLFIPVLTFVFGEAQLGGRAAVVSLARLRETFDRRPAPPELVEARLLKECLHELGHTYGLVHCAGASCVMSRSNTVMDVDGKTAAFCRACRLRLRETTS